MDSASPTILERLERLERQVVEMRFSDRIVGTDYVAELLDISVAAAIRGCFGTGKIPRARKKPIGYHKSDVDKFFRQMTKSIPETAAEIRAKTKTRRRSIIKTAGK